MWTYKLPERKIKFRAWDKEQKVMIYDDMYCLDSTQSAFILLNGDIRENWRGAKVSSFILLQYTWLEDKNWVEIYEGDIVSASDWERDYFLPVTISPYKWVMFWAFDQQNCSFSLWVEVIGNVFENIDRLDSFYISGQTDKTL